MKRQTTKKVDSKPVSNSKHNGVAFEVFIGLTVLVIFLFLLRRIFKSKPEPELTKSIDEDGYIILLPINEREHRYIARKKMGRNLTLDEHVHHINGNKQDNEINNLCLMDSEKHQHFHAWLRWKKDKDGMYPSIYDQKRALVEQYGGTLLENVSGRQGKQCPGCNSPMVLRIAGKGKNKGRQFWGCSRYPTCKSSVAA